MRNLPGDDNKMPVYARIAINGKRIELSVKQLIVAEDWNEKRGMAKTTKDECRALNNYLEQLRSSFVARYRERALEKKQLQ